MIEELRKLAAARVILKSASMKPGHADLVSVPSRIELHLAEHNSKELAHHFHNEEDGGRYFGRYFDEDRDAARAVETFLSRCRDYRVEVPEMKRLTRIMRALNFVTEVNALIGKLPFPSGVLVMCTSGDLLVFEFRRGANQSQPLLSIDCDDEKFMNLENKLVRALCDIPEFQELCEKESAPDEQK